MYPVLFEEFMDFCASGKEWEFGGKRWEFKVICCSFKTHNLGRKRDRINTIYRIRISKSGRGVELFPRYSGTFREM